MRKPFTGFGLQTCATFSTSRSNSIRPPQSSRLRKTTVPRPPILSASNAVIGLARERFTKNLRSQWQAGQKPGLILVADDVGQVNFIVETILQNLEAGIALKEQAVLFRTSHHGAMLEIELPVQHSVHQIRRPEVHRGSACQRHAGRVAMGGRKTLPIA